MPGTHSALQIKKNDDSFHNSKTADVLWLLLSFSLLAVYFRYFLMVFDFFLLFLLFFSLEFGPRSALELNSEFAQ